MKKVFLAVAFIAVVMIAFYAGSVYSILTANFEGWTDDGGYTISYWNGAREDEYVVS